ncbi:MAG: 3-dehydroquinate dehydratase [Actinomycetota bacterium]|nr:3-dehydroquinate dehydratase [Actinomycetota bacterium]
MARIFVLNGVNLASLGERRPEVYGEQTLQDVDQLLRNAFPDVAFVFRQTDHEGEFVAWIHEAAHSDGLVLNPGAWTHYSYAIHDALETVSVPKVEVHLSNIHARKESWRHSSVISPVVDAVVAGMGASGYLAAVRYILGR